MGMAMHSSSLFVGFGGVACVWLEIDLFYCYMNGSVLTKHHKESK